MWRKLLIISLLLSLASLPVAQAIDPVAGSDDTGKVSQDFVVMDCGHVGPDHCIDFDNCVSGSHTNCDSKTKSGLLLSVPIEPSCGVIFDAHLVDQYPSHHAEILLRPPRNT